MTTPGLSDRRSALWRAVRWSVPRIAWTLYVVVNLWIVAIRVRPGEFNIDWLLFNELPGLLDQGQLYAQTDYGRWVWSPVAAWLMVTVTQLGYWPWVAAHFAALFALRDWRLVLVLLVSWGFWVDVVQGHHVTFLFVLAALAIRGNRLAGLAFLGLWFIVPRPLQLPVMAWLLWRDPWLWRPFAVLFVAHAAAVLVSGYGSAWLTSVLNQTTTGPHGWNLGPAYFLGLGWLAIGLPLAAWLTHRGLLGWAGLAMSHYVLPQYLIFVWLPRPQPVARGPQPPPVGIVPSYRASLTSARTGSARNRDNYSMTAVPRDS